MFVRFRSARARLQASLVDTHRINGKVRAEHVAALGCIAQPADVVDRVEFWRSLHERLARLATRLPDPEAVYAAIDARIPMPTADEQRAAMIEAAEADAALWESLRDMHQGTAEEQEALAKDVARQAQEAHAAAAQAAEKATRAQDRLAKLKRGEDVNGGALRPFDVRKALRDAGLTERAIAHARDVAKLSETQFEEYVAEASKRGEKAQRRIEFALMRRLNAAPR